MEMDALNLANNSMETIIALSDKYSKLALRDVSVSNNVEIELTLVLNSTTESPLQLTILVIVSLDWNGQRHLKDVSRSVHQDNSTITLMIILMDVPKLVILSTASYSLMLTILLVIVQLTNNTGL